MKRRAILGATAGLAAMPTRLRASPWLSPDLPAGTRDAATFTAPPGKSKLICLSDRPPNYETAIEMFRQARTPNEAFFIRYHLANIPTMAELGTFTLTVGGDAAERTVTISLDDLQKKFRHAEVAAVCQCSGNRRGLSDPHVAGVEWGYGAMGCATWRGPKLKDVLAAAGIKSDAAEVWVTGADTPALPATPAFRKSLPIDKAREDDVIIAVAMNGAPLPHLNGYPARLVVPGWTATYWMKHLNDIQIAAKPLDSFWMKTAYRVPAGMFAVDQPFPTQDNQTNRPITDIVVNSVIANPISATRQPAGGFTVEGVAWDRGHGIKTVEVSLDGGASWKPAELGPDQGRFAFRKFSLRTGTLKPGELVISSRATSMAGEAQAEKLKFNPAGYHNNVPQRVAVTVA